MSDCSIRACLASPQRKGLGGRLVGVRGEEKEYITVLFSKLAYHDDDVAFDRNHFCLRVEVYEVEGKSVAGDICYSGDVAEQGVRFCEGGRFAF